MNHLPGKTLGRYQLTDLLGEGGMGEVYRAFDPVLKRDVAIKTIHPHLLRKPGFKERFLQEAVAAARLHHPGIVQVFDSGEENGVLYMVMAFISGENLQELLEELKEQGTWVVLPEAVELVQQVSQAVDHAHRNGVLHRDIKPANIMLASEPCDGLPYRSILTDLGLAKLVEGGIETQSGASMGTPAYMSPEQALGLPIDARSDVYSLGALLYHLCAGQPPFPAKSITEIIRIHVRELLPPSPRSRNPLISPQLEAVILKTLERDPSRRFADAGQFALALGELLPSGKQPGKVLPAEILSKPAAPTQLNSTVMDSAPGTSLATLLEQSQAKHRGKSVLDEFPAEKPAAGVDQIQVIEPGKTARAYAVRAQVITVGREPGNQIVLDDPKVSRTHLRIDQTSSGYQVTDLGSSNGSYLNGVKLLKGITQAWAPDQPLQVGGTFLRLITARETVGTQLQSAAQPAVRQSQSQAALWISSTQLAVETGSSVSLEFAVRNLSSAVEHYQVSLDGIPSDWIKNQPNQPLKCMPGEEQKLTLFLQPPRIPQSKAGHYPITLRAISQARPSEIITATANLTVAPFRQFAAQLKPQKVRAGDGAQVVIKNQGNAPETFQLEFQDPADVLVFNPPQASLLVPEGQQGSFAYRGLPRGQRWFGGLQSHPFSATVRPSTGGEQPLQGELVSQAMMPKWVLALAALLAGCILLVGVYLFSQTMAKQAPAAADNGNAAQAPAAGAPSTDTQITLTWMASRLNAADATSTQKAVEATTQAEETKQALEAAQAKNAKSPGKIAFVRWIDGHHELFVMNADGSNQTRLTYQEDVRGYPSFSPDGKQIAYISEGKIYLISADGSNRKTLTRGSSDPYGPDSNVGVSWSPGGQYIAFTCGDRQSSNRKICMINADGTGMRSLTNNSGDDFSTSWSPDGRQILFLSESDGVYHTHVINIDNLGQTTFPLDYGNGLAWSPDGKQIAFSSGDNSGSPCIYKQNIDGSGLTKLTDIDGVDPVWSPDGKQIAFVHGLNRNDIPQIYIMNADGSDLKNLSTLSYSDMSPAWGQ
jgi:eukaryotic-like serine/threonine-protein kinase